MKIIKKFKEMFNKQKLWKKILIVSSIIISLLVILGSIIILVLFQNYYNKTKEINSTSMDYLKVTTRVYDREDKFIGSLSQNNIHWVTLTNENGEFNIAPKYLEGLVATEDKNFENHNGIDIIGMIKASIDTVLGGDTRGGSTISMQAAKLIFMNDWITPNEEGLTKRQIDPIGYKLSQMAYAIKMEKVFSKEEILEAYVNALYFGEGGYGIVNASKYYYNKEPKDLNLNEATILAGMTQLPNYYNPYKNLEATTERRNIVLYRLFDEQYITKEEYDAALLILGNEGLVDSESRDFDINKVIEPYLDQVYRELVSIFKEKGIEDFDINTAGMSIYTNVDMDLQRHTVETLNSDKKGLFQDEEIQMGSVMLDTQNGQILAIGNGRNGHGGLLGTNYATNYYRQPGSSVKPLLDYAPAIEYLKWSTAHELNDVETSYDGGSGVVNADGQFMGPITMQKAIGTSRNTTALQAFKDVSNTVGLDKIINIAKGLGFMDINQNTFNQAYSIGGWSVGTTPLELAGAYATLGNEGIYNQPKAIRKINIVPESNYYDRVGDVIEIKSEGKQIYSPTTAYMTSQMMLATNSEALGYAGRATVNGIPDLSIKTGTSDWGNFGVSQGIPKYSQRDKWVASFNPNITTVTWTGYNQESEKKGKYIYLDTLYETVAFKELMSIIPKLNKSYLKDDVYVIPEDVVSLKIASDVFPIKADPNGIPFLFIKDSPDYNLVFDKFESIDLVKPNLSQNVVINGENIGLTWDYIGELRENASWNIFVNNILIKNVNDTSAVIKLKEINEKVPCNENYEIKVELVLSKDGKDRYSDKSDPINIKVSNNNC